MLENRDSLTARRETTIDEGLRSYMNGIYARMSVGVLLTALVAMAVGTSPVLFKVFMGGPQMYLFIFAPVLVQWFGFRPERMSSAKLQGAFFLISGLYGISFSTIAFVATVQPGFIVEVARAFFITVSMFAGLSIFGYTTKKDLSGMRQFIFMGIIGVFVMSIMNMFFMSSGFSILISMIAIVAFSGLTVWETQQLKQLYFAHGGSSETASRLAWAGAYTLYLSFIALFMHILNLLMAANRN